MRVAAACLALLPLLACATSDQEMLRLRAQNDLLRAEIEVIKRNCAYYRELEIEAEEEARP